MGSRLKTPSASIVSDPKRPAVLALMMLVLVAAFERWALGKSYSQYFVDVFATQSFAGALVRVAGAVAMCAAQYLFFWASFRSSYSWRLLYLTFFTVATLAQYGYVRLTGDFMSPLDVGLAVRSTKYWGPIATVGFDWRALIPAVVYGAALAIAPRGSRRNFLRFALVLVLTVSIHASYGASGYLLRQGRPDIQMGTHAAITGSMQAFARALTMVAWNAVMDLSRGGRRQVPAVEGASPTNHVLLIIDEAIRADHLSVNGYERPTTPKLEALRDSGRLDNWGIAAAFATSSEPAALALLTGVTFPDPARRALSAPTVFQFAKAMDYETHLLDGGVAGPRFGITQSDLRFVDDYRTTRQFGDDPDTDFRIAAEVRRILTEPRGQFIVVFKRGNHFPFSRNYPYGRGIWAPFGQNAPLNERNDPSLWTEWIDSYDDGIRYNVNGFFEHLLPGDGSLPRTVGIYTSDHGQPYQPRTDADFRTSVTVPLFLFGDERPAVDTGYRAGHQNLLASLLDLMQVPANLWPVDVARSLIRARASDIDPRPVFHGDLWGEGPYAVKDFDALATSDLPAGGSPPR